MLNVTRMNLYRLIKSKETYITLGIFAAFVIFTIIILTIGVKNPEQVTVKPEQNSVEFELNYKSPDEVYKDSQSEENIGLSISESALLEDTSLLRLTLELFKGGFFLIFTGIFTVIFVCDETSTGFIKNIAGTVKRRWYLVIGQIVPLAVFLLAEILIAELLSLIGGKLFIPNFTIGNLSSLFGFLFLQFLLQLAFAVLSMFFVYVTKNKATISIIAVCCFSAGLGGLATGFIEQTLQKIGVSLNLSSYLIVNNVQGLRFPIEKQKYFHIIFIFLAAVLVYNIISSIIISKRDI